MVLTRLSFSNGFETGELDVDVEHEILEEDIEIAAVVLTGMSGQIVVRHRMGRRGHFVPGLRYQGPSLVGHHKGQGQDSRTPSSPEVVQGPFRVDEVPGQGCSMDG